MAFEELIEAWDGEEVVVHRDEPTSSWMLIGIHDTTLGPAMGGTRLTSYASPADALDDVLRLAEAMTWKQAAAELPYGGGKAVIAVPAVPARGSEERRALLLRYAELVESLHGTYVTAADMNTGEADMDTLGERTSHVLGRSTANGGSGDPGAATALGVFHGIRATVRRAFGDDALEGRSVLVQGLGSVGSRLAGHLHDAGASLLLADVDAERATTLADELGAKVVRADDVIGTECDVFAPCATGKVLSRETIPRAALPHRRRSGEQPARDAGGRRPAPRCGCPLRPRLRRERRWRDPPRRDARRSGGTTRRRPRRLEGIGDTLLRIFDRAEREGLSPAAAADRMARERVAVARGE